MIESHGGGAALLAAFVSLLSFPMRYLDLIPPTLKELFTVAAGRPLGCATSAGEVTEWNWFLANIVIGVAGAHLSAIDLTIDLILRLRRSRPARPRQLLGEIAEPRKDFLALMDI